MPIGVTAAPYAKFPQAGTRHGGKIVDFRIVQTTEPKSHRPQYLQQDDETGSWEKVFSAFRPDGKPNNPITQWEITVDTGVEDENGDSELRIFVDPRKGRRGSTTFGKRGGDAVAIALKKAKAHRVGLEIGGDFFLTFDGKIEDGENRVNTWSAEYTAPDGGPGSGKPLDEIPHLVGGARYDKAAELAKWETAKAGGVVAAQPAFVPPAAPAAPPVASPEARASATLGIRDTSVSSAGSSAGAYDDSEPPF